MRVALPVRTAGLPPVGACSIGAARSQVARRPRETVDAVSDGAHQLSLSTLRHLPPKPAGSKPLPTRARAGARDLAPDWATSSQSGPDRAFVPGVRRVTLVAATDPAGRRAPLVGSTHVRAAGRRNRFKLTRIVRADGMKARARDPWFATEAATRSRPRPRPDVTKVASYPVSSRTTDNAKDLPQDTHRLRAPPTRAPFARSWERDGRAAPGAIEVPDRIVSENVASRSAEDCLISLRPHSRRRLRVEPVIFVRRLDQEERPRRSLVERNRPCPDILVREQRVHVEPLVSTPNPIDGGLGVRVGRQERSDCVATIPRANASPVAVSFGVRSPPITQHDVRAVRIPGSEVAPVLLELLNAVALDHVVPSSSEYPKYAGSSNTSNPCLAAFSITESACRKYASFGEEKSFRTRNGWLP